MLSDAVIVQIISSIVVLAGLWFHRQQGAKENRAIAETLNGHRTVLLEKIEALEKQVLNLVTENMKLLTQLEKKTTDETDSP